MSLTNIQWRSKLKTERERIHMRVSKEPEVRKQEMLDTAMRVFAEKGFEAVSYTHLDVYKRQRSKKWSRKAVCREKPGQAAFLVRRNSIQWMSSFKPQRK